MCRHGLPLQACRADLMCGRSPPVKPGYDRDSINCELLLLGELLAVQMAELDFQFLARPEPFAIISGFSQAGEVFLASWRLGERLFWGAGRDGKRSGEADRGCGLPRAYQPRARPAGIGLRSGPGVRVGEARPAHGPAASGFHRLYIKAPGLRWDSGQT